MSDCFVHTKISLATKNKEAGFMGPTHAISGIAILLALIAWLPEITYQALGTNNFWAITLAIIVTAGGALLPDLDNTHSTSKSSLGFVGDGLSIVFRSIATVIQTIIRTKKDESTQNPHRGWWHTIPASLLLGGLAYIATQVPTKISIPFMGEITLGWLFALIITWMIVHIALAGVAKKQMKKIKKQPIIGELLTFIVSLVCTLAIFINIPSTVNFWWLGVSIALGCIIHILGDCFTTAGAPILFPLSAPLKGKFWWKTRFTSMKAGGELEVFIFGGFVVLSIVAILKIVGVFG